MTVLRDAFPRLGRVLQPLAALGLSIDSELDALEPQALPVLIAALVRHLEANEHQKLATLVTDLSIRGNAPVAPSLRQSRSRNSLARAGVVTWSDLGQLSPAGLRRISGVGTRTVQDILHCCVERALRGPAVCQTYPSYRADFLDTAIEALQLLAAWAAREPKMAHLGDLWQLTSGVGALPSDLQDLWSDFIHLDPRDVAGEALAGTSLEDLIDELLGGLDNAERTVYEQRVLIDRPRTLEEVGQALGVTRERARQIQVSAQDAIESLLASQRFRPLLWRAAELRSLLGSAAERESETTVAAFRRCIRDVSSDVRSVVQGVLLHLAGPYRSRDGWLELADAPELAAVALAAKADENGLLPLAAAHEWLSAEGVHPAFHDAWLERSGRFRRFGSTLVLWSGSIADKSVAILALRGKPANAETLVGEVGEGHSPRTAQNGFLADDRLVRVGRSDWGLRSWNLEEYTGITDEIAQRIHAAGGRARLDDMSEELVRQFGVKRGSVRVYAEAPMFVLEGGWVRFRGDEEPFETGDHVASCRGAYSPAADLVSISILVDSETLRGSGRVFSAGVAAALGVAPGQPRTFIWDAGELTVTWPKSAAFGPSLGSARGLALSVGAGEGDYVRLDFNLTTGRVACVRIPPTVSELPLDRALQLLTGVDGGADPVGNIALALHTSASDVRRRLIERGDALVAALLPPAALDPGLESALSELAELLEKQT